MNLPIRDRLASQLSSGRWILTVTAGIAFIVLVVAYVQGKPSISGDAICALCSLVFMAYFQKKRNGEQNGNGPEGEVK